MENRHNYFKTVNDTITNYVTTNQNSFPDFQEVLIEEVQSGPTMTFECDNSDPSTTFMYDSSDRDLFDDSQNTISGNAQCPTTNQSLFDLEEVVADEVQSGSISENSECVLHDIEILDDITITPANAKICKRKFVLEQKNENKENVEAKKIRQNLNPDTEIKGLFHKMFDRQDQINQRLSNLEKANAAIKTELATLNKYLRENNILTNKVFKVTTKALGGEPDDAEVEAATFLPISSVQHFEKLEERLQDRSFAHAMHLHLLKQKGVTNSVDVLFRNIMTDGCAFAYNWDGRCGKKPLSNSKIFDKILSELFQMGQANFEKDCRRAIEMSHNRFKQTKSATKKKLQKTLLSPQ